jgi:hypothetical protein
MRVVGQRIGESSRGHEAPRTQSSLIVQGHRRSRRQLARAKCTTVFSIEHLVKRLDSTDRIVYHVHMRNADLEKKKQLEELEGWLPIGFREYADLCRRRGQVFVEMTKVTVRKYEGCNYSPETIARMEYRGSIHENIRIQIESCAEWFGRILRGEVHMSDADDAQELRATLHRLMKSGCPAVPLVELMLACTSNYGITISEVLSMALPLNDYLRRVTEDTRYPRFPRCARRFKDAVPLSIQFMLETKPMYGELYGNTREEKSQAARVAFHLAFFYTFLKVFKQGYQEQTFLLRAMQFVRRRAPVVADYLQTTNKNTFTYSSIQRRVLRFFDAYPASAGLMRKEIREYFSGPRNGKHATLLGIY